jgi:hypothetical protein
MSGGDYPSPYSAQTFGPTMDKLQRELDDIAGYHAVRIESSKNYLNRRTVVLYMDYEDAVRLLERLQQKGETDEE